jgi:hypothetical protein
MNNGIYIRSRGAGNFNSVKTAVVLANQLFRDERFYERISAHSFFHFSDIAPTKIAQLIRDSRFQMSINMYYALNPLKNIDGYDDLEDPFVIHLNAWKTDRSPESMCNTIVHACVHAVNACHLQYYFGHGDNVPAGKENSAPYWIGASAQQMVSKEEAIIIPLEHDNVTGGKDYSKYQLHRTKYLTLT